MTPVALSYFFYFCLFGILMPFLSPILLDLGYSPQQAGLVQSGTYLMSMVVPLWIGRITDKHFTLDISLRFFGYLTLFVSILLYFSLWKPLWLIPLLLLFSAVRSPIIPLLDATAMKVSDNHPGRYGLLRSLGSLGFAFAVVLFGYLLEKGHHQVFFIGIITSVSLYCLSSQWLPRERRDPEAPLEQGFWRGLSSNWWFWLAAMMCHWFCFGIYHYGFTLLLLEAGLDQSLSGWIWSLGVLVEIFCFLLGSAVFRRWHYRKVLFAAFFGNFARWLLMALFPNGWVFAACQLFHGTGFALFHSSALSAIAQRAQGQHRASYQTLYSAAMGCASILSTAFAGWLHQHMPLRVALFWFLPFQALAIFLLWRHPLNPPTEKRSISDPSSDMIQVSNLTKENCG